MHEFEVRLKKGEIIISDKDGSKVDLSDLIEEVDGALSNLSKRRAQPTSDSLLTNMLAERFEKGINALEAYKRGLLVGAGLVKPAMVLDDGVYLALPRPEKGRSNQ